MSELLKLAERVEGLGSEITCPLCGETDFDVPGISMHWFRWCEVNRAVGMSNSNVEVASNLCAIAAQEPSS